MERVAEEASVAVESVYSQVVIAIEGLDLQEHKGIRTLLVELSVKKVGPLCSARDSPHVDDMLEGSKLIFAYEEPASVDRGNVKAAITEDIILLRAVRVSVDKLIWNELLVDSWGKAFAKLFLRELHLGSNVTELIGHELQRAARLAEALSLDQLGLAICALDLMSSGHDLEARTAELAIRRCGHHIGPAARTLERLNQWKRN